MVHSNTDLWGFRIPTGGELRIIRDKLGLTQRDVEENTKFKSSTLGKWENGNTHPNSDDLRELLTYYRSVYETEYK